MKLLFSNNETVELSIDDSALGQTYQKIYKHLSRAPLNFREWYNPYYQDDITYPELVSCLAFYAEKVGVTVDQEIVLVNDQSYFNSLHKIYETSYNGDSAWLDFHEHIHMCERHHRRSIRFLLIDYREKAGPLERKFDPAWLEKSTTKICAGDAFVQWSELGKNPYEYWQNNESNNVERMCRLIKPWLILRPKINIALDDIDTMANKQISEFESWWNQYREAWSRHWNVPLWTTEQILSYTVIGRVPDIADLKSKLKNRTLPIGVQA
jgi:Txe/YoeB family toxin of Txe-Axe toxin-antitoxin module